MILSLDNAIIHDTTETEIVLNIAKGLFLSSATSSLQPMAVRFIAAPTRRYFKIGYDHSVDANEANAPVSCAYFKGQLIAMKKPTKI